MLQVASKDSVFIAWKTEAMQWNWIAMQESTSCTISWETSLSDSHNSIIMLLVSVLWENSHPWNGNIGITESFKTKKIRLICLFIWLFIYFWKWKKCSSTSFGVELRKISHCYTHTVMERLYSSPFHSDFTQMLQTLLSKPRLTMLLFLKHYFLYFFSW